MTSTASTAIASAAIQDAVDCSFGANRTALTSDVSIATEHTTHTLAELRKKMPTIEAVDDCVAPTVTSSFWPLRQWVPTEHEK